MCLITLRLMLPYTFLHVPGILETLQKMRCANITFQESIVARKQERIWKMYFYPTLLFKFPRINSGKKARKNPEDVFYGGSPSLSF